MMMKKLFTVFTLIFCFSLNAEIIIGSKSFTEQLILGEMAAILLKEKYNQEVTKKLSLGGTKVALDALRNGDIHLYPDYTGTGYSFILQKNDLETDPDKIYREVQKEYLKRFDIIWSPPIGFNNTYALAVREDDKRFENIDSVSQLSGKTNQYRFGGPHEFMERNDGYRNFVDIYKLNFNTDKITALDSGLMYSAIRDKNVDMIMSYSTDGRILAYNLKILDDDRKFFPPYYAAWIAKSETIRKFPALKKMFSDFEELIDEETMVELNNQVDTFKLEPSTVARNFLIKRGLIKGTPSEKKRGSGFLNYVKAKKRYLIKITKDHLILSFSALFLALLISLPTGIILTRLPSISQPVFAFINTVQTVPSLALLGFLIPLMGIGKAPAILALFLYSLLPLVRNTYTGIKAVDKNFIEASRGMGLTNAQILMRVELPLAMPIILAGIRTASVIVIGTATLAALVGAGGLGDPIFRGVATVNGNLILLGAIPSAILAIVVDKLLGWSEYKLVSNGLRLANK